MTGATLLTVTVLFSVSLPPSPSLTVTLTVTVSITPAGSSDQAHLNEPVLVASSRLSASRASSDSVPLVPQLALGVQVSAPGSVKLKV